MSTEMDGSASPAQVHPPSFSDYLSKPPPVFCLTFVFVAGRALAHAHTHARTQTRTHANEVSFQTVSPPPHNLAPPAVVGPRITRARQVLRM